MYYRILVSGATREHLTERQVPSSLSLSDLPIESRSFQPIGSEAAVTDIAAAADNKRRKRLLILLLLRRMETEEEEEVVDTPLLVAVAHRGLTYSAVMAAPLADLHIQCPWWWWLLLLRRYYFRIVVSMLLQLLHTPSDW
jgi:hypothetical protein